MSSINSIEYTASGVISLDCYSVTFKNEGANTVTLEFADTTTIILKSKKTYSYKSNVSGKITENVNATFSTAGTKLVVIQIK